MLRVVPGQRDAEHVQRLVEPTPDRLNGRTPDLIATDEYGPYREAILKAWGHKTTQPPTGKRDLPRKSYYEPTDPLKSVTVHKREEKGRVVNVEPRVAFGGPHQVQAALQASHLARPPANQHRLDRTIAAGPIVTAAPPRPARFARLTA